MASDCEYLKIRAARCSELGLLNELCLRSKAVWGYDDDFMAECRAELSISVEELEQTDVAVAERDDRIIGVAQVKIEGQDAELLKLFIEPDAIGAGAGRALFDWTCTVARTAGAHNLLIDSDPYAAPFYRRMGARDIGLAPSGSIPGRMLPMLALCLIE